MKPNGQGKHGGLNGEGRVVLGYGKRVYDLYWDSWTWRSCSGGKGDRGFLCV